MNEEQTEHFLKLMAELVYTLKPKQKVVYNEVKLLDRQQEHLKRFKEFVTGEFYTTLTERQQKQIIKLQMDVEN